VLSRIRALLDTSRGREWAYAPHPCLAETDLLAWEAAHGLALPDEYRVFLREVGDGGMMPGSYCDFIIEPLAEVRGAPSAATPFPVTAERLRQRFRQLQTEGRPANGVLFPELEAIWGEAGQPPGCLVFGQYPSADALFLVTAGDLRGSVWCAVCSGIPEMDRSGEPVGFLDWFADVLAEFEGGREGRPEAVEPAWGRVAAGRLAVRPRRHQGTRADCLRHRHTAIGQRFPPAAGLLPFQVRIAQVRHEHVSRLVR
jgi:hypothetical protein